jgi:tRNA dimethylallyltransferase
MMDDGLLEEARGLWQNGIRNVQSVQAIGYKELYQYFEGFISLEEAVELIKKHTRHYAKRQMTYFRNKVEISWFDANSNKENIVDGIFSILKGFEQAESNK